MRWILQPLVLLVLLAPSLFGQAIATLRPGDMLDMRLGGMPAEYAAEFALQYTVGQDGTINVPTIGEIKAAGMTSTQLERTIQNRLMAEKIFTRPTVIVSIASVARYVSVSGGVRAPQRLQWTADLTLSSAIGNSGGLSDFGSPKGIRIVRDAKVVGEFNYKEILKDPSRDPKLLPGDQVLVKE